MSDQFDIRLSDIRGLSEDFLENLPGGAPSTSTLLPLPTDRVAPW
jgi:hypothetical protein